MAYTHRFTKSQKSHSLKVSCNFLYKPCIIRRIKLSLVLCVHYVRIIRTPFFLLFQANIIRRSLLPFSSSYAQDFSFEVGFLGFLGFSGQD